MREILFRGKGVRNGVWVYGVPVYAGGETFIMANDLHWLPGGSDDVFDEIIPETLGQYTGMDDKYGNRIFEGDVVLSNTVFREYYLMNPERYTIGFSDGTFIFEGCGQWDDGSNSWCSIENIELWNTEIIGNIHGESA